MAAPKIGVDKVYVAALTADTSLGLTYGTPVQLAGAAKITGNPNGALVTDYGDNAAFYTANARRNLQLALELIDIDPAVLAQVLGQTRANNITGEQYNDQSPFYAAGFRVWYGATDYEYFWYLKGKFAIPEQGAETKKNTISPQHVTINAEFVKPVYNDYVCIHGRTGAGLDSGTANSWFNQVIIAPTISLSAVTFSSIAGSSTAHTITLTFSKGASESFALAAPIDDSQITVSVVSTGAVVAGTNTYTPSAASTSPTVVVYNPNITNVAYLVSVHGLRDVNGVAVTYASKLVTPA
jgi:phi13 family phage major tail protein